MAGGEKVEEDKEEDFKRRQGGCEHLLVQFSWLQDFRLASMIVYGCESRCRPMVSRAGGR